MLPDEVVPDKKKDVLPDKKKDKDSDTHKDKDKDSDSGSHVKEVGLAKAYILAQDNIKPSPKVGAVLAHINTNPVMRIPGKPYKADKNAEGIYDIYYNPDIYNNYTEGDKDGKNDGITERTQEELDDLAADPAHNGKSTPKTEREREVGLALEKQGELKPPIKRDPTGAAEFIDGNNQAWDIKAFNSNFLASKGGFSLERDALKVKNEILAGENVIIDTLNLSNEHKLELMTKLEQLGISDKVIFY